MRFSTSGKQKIFTREFLNILLHDRCESKICLHRQIILILSLQKMNPKVSIQSLISSSNISLLSIICSKERTPMRISNLLAIQCLKSSLREKRSMMEQPIFDQSIIPKNSKNFSNISGKLSSIEHVLSLSSIKKNFVVTIIFSCARGDVQKQICQILIIINLLSPFLKEIPNLQKKRLKI